jgi:outer membrane protein assembly factor BamB
VPEPVGSPIISSVGLVHVSTDRSVHGIDLKSGRRRWTIGDTGAPAVSRGRLFVGTEDGRLIAYAPSG